MPTDYTIVLGALHNWTGDGGITHLWSPEETLPIQTLKNPIANPQDTTTYYLIGWDEFGREGYDSVTINTLILYILSPPKCIYS